MTTNLDAKGLWKAAEANCPYAIAVEPNVILAVLLGENVTRINNWRIDGVVPPHLYAKLKLMASTHGHTFIKLKCHELGMTDKVKWKTSHE